MYAEGLNRTHLKIIRLVYRGERTISEIARHLGLSLSWTSECVEHLTSMDLVRRTRVGSRVIICQPRSELSQSLALLIFEAPMLDLSKLLDKAGLKVLPLLLEPGMNVSDLKMRTGLSGPTIRDRIRTWRGMGTVQRERTGHRYILDPSRKVLKVFLVSYMRWYNGRVLNDTLPGAIIVWQWRDEYLFSIDETVGHHAYLRAGPTRLEELGYDLIHTREYYMNHPGLAEVGEEEALVQSFLSDPQNPRMIRFIEMGIQQRGADPGSILAFGSKYGIEDALKRVVNIDG